MRSGSGAVPSCPKRRFLIPSPAEEKFRHMYHRSFPLLAVISLVFFAGGCESLWTSSAKQTKKQYEEVLMPLQTGSRLHRRTYVPTGPEEKKKSTAKKKTEKEKAPKLEAEPSATPKPEEESTPPPDRFR